MGVTGWTPLRPEKTCLMWLAKHGLASLLAVEPFSIRPRASETHELGRVVQENDCKCACQIRREIGADLLSCDALRFALLLITFRPLLRPTPPRQKSVGMA